MPVNETILIVDDQHRMRDSLKALLSLRGYEVKTCSNGRDALTSLTEGTVDLVLLDISLPDMDGFQVMETVACQHLDIPVILMTGHASTASAVKALRTGAYDYLIKPFDPEELYLSVRIALNRRMLRKSDGLIRGKAPEDEKKGSPQHIRATDCLFIVDPTHQDGPVIVDVNEPACSAHGYTFNELIGKPFSSLCAEAAEKLGLEKILCLQPGESLLFESEHRHRMRMVKKDGTVFWAYLTVTAYEDGDGRIRCHVAMRDFIESRGAEEALAEARILALQEKNRLQAIMEALPIGVAIVDAQGGALQSNRVYDSMWGDPRPLPKGIDDYSLYKAWWPETGKPVQPEEWASAIAIRKGETVTGQVIIIQGFDGNHRFIINSAAPFRDADGNIAGSAVAILDISELKRAQEALKETEGRYKALVDLAPDGVLVHDGDRIIYCNRAALHLHGAESPDQLIGMSPADLVHPDERNTLKTRAQRALRGHIAPLFEYRYLRKDGKELNVEASAAPINWQGRSAVQVIIRDITARKITEKALNESRQDLNRAQAVGRIGSWRLNVGRNELRWSEENHRIFGISEGTPLTYETFLGTVHPEDRAYVHERWMAALRGEPYDIEHRIVLQDTVKWVRERAELEFGPNGELLGGFGTTQDITDRKLAEAALRDSEARFKLLSETAEQLLAAENPQTIIDTLCRNVMEHLDCQTFFNFLVDEQAGRLHLNACAGIPDSEARKIEWLDYGVAVCGCVALGRERIVANDILEIPDPRTDLIKSYGIRAYACHPLMTRDRLIGTLSFGTKTRPRFNAQELSLMKTVTDEVAVALERMKLIDMLQRSRDELEIRVRNRTEELEKATTEKMALQAEAMQTGHLASLGELAASVAHEINNPINGIINYAQILANDAMAESRELDISKRIIKEGDRIADIVRSLLSFARDDQKGKGPCSFHDILRDTLTLVHAPMRKEGIHLILTMADQLPPVFVNTQHIQQVLLNVIINARYALNQKYPGLHDEKVIEIDGQRIRGEGRDFLRLTFLDRGIGIGPDILPKVMEPFFSTKPSQHGTGLGLSICNRIIKEHDGRIEIESVQGQYTLVIIELPVWEEE